MTVPGRMLLDTRDENDVSGETVELVNPSTGELLSLRDAQSGQLAEFIEAVREWEANARLAKAVVSGELHRRMDAEAKWTLRDGPYEIVGQSPNRVEYDVERLRTTLKELVEGEQITLEAAQAALKREVTFKPAKRGIDALLKLGGDVKKRIEACGHPPTRGRTVKLSKGRTDG